MIKEVKRGIARGVERELWGRSAGRCEFSGCNKILYRSPVTQEPVNISEKAHIYSFSPGGPRGRGPYVSNEGHLNSIDNLLLVCQACHETIDQDKSSERYSPDLLIKWKQQHEYRVALVTGIQPNKKSHIVLYGANIGEQNSPLQAAATCEAMFPERYPAEERPIILSMFSTHEDHTSAYWQIEGAHLRKAFNRDIRPRLEGQDSCHFSLFALAPQPLLVLLGTLFTDKVPVDPYQLHREPQSWKWQSHPDGFRFRMNRPDDASYDPALVVSLSDRISHDRVTSVLGNKINIWELTVEDCHNDFLRSQAQLSMFRNEVRRLMIYIKEAHGQSRPLRVFPAMPVSCAVEFGRVRMPKADMPWIIYDQNNKAGGFIESIQLMGGESE